MLSPDELDLIAALVALFSLVIAGIFLVAEQPTRYTWVSFIGGGVLVTLIEFLATYRRLYD